jgi:hypothetical protein
MAKKSLIINPTVNINIVDLISRASELSKSEIRRRIKFGSVKVLRDREWVVLVAPEEEITIENIPVVIRYGKRDYCKVNPFEVKFEYTNDKITSGELLNYCLYAEEIIKEKIK